jgi:hypothetical protein
MNEQAEEFPRLDFEDWSLGKKTFRELLEPYRDGGTSADQSVIRTVDSILTYLLKKTEYSQLAITHAIFEVFEWLNEGNQFKGDGTYGSKGRELVNAIHMKCGDICHGKHTGRSYFAEKYHQKPAKRKFREKLNYWLLHGHWK